jgi:hypothetical protein
MVFLFMVFSLNPQAENDPRPAADPLEPQKKGPTGKNPIGPKNNSQSCLPKQDQPEKA